MSPEIATLRIQQLDSTLERYKRVLDTPAPRAGWIKAIRQALGMTADQLARRLRIKQPTLSRLEASESQGTITLESLHKAAEALDCELVYALVPRHTLRQQLETRAREFARERVARVAHTMHLEDQAVADEHLRRQAEELVTQILRKPPRDLWA